MPSDDQQIARVRVTKTFHIAPPCTGMGVVKFKRVVHPFGETQHDQGVCEKLVLKLVLKLVRKVNGRVKGRVKGE